MVNLESKFTADWIRIPRKIRTRKMGENQQLLSRNIINLFRCKGIYIIKIEAGSAAESGGLKVGDQIYEANSYDFTMVTLSQAIRRIQRKDTLKLKVGRADLSREPTSGLL